MYFEQYYLACLAHASSYPELPKLESISALEVKSLLDQAVPLLDVRPGDEFASGHVPGSISVPLSGMFAPWAATVLGHSSKPVLVAASAEQLAAARLQLARVGMESVRGYLHDGVDGWTQAGFALATLVHIPVRTLYERVRSYHVQPLDVRRRTEWQAGHIEGASWQPLDDFKTTLPKMDLGTPIAVHCTGGYRSLIASSLLQRAGFRNVSNVIGGFDAWQRAELPVVSEVPLV